MVLVKNKKEKSSPVERSVYASDVKIDKAGVQWKEKTIWFRQELLSKLKVIAHFEKKSNQELIDEALRKFIGNKLENSMAMRKLVSKSSGKVVKGSS